MNPRGRDLHLEEKPRGSRLVFLSVVGLAFLLGCFPMADFDVWWHLRTGELIPERGVPLSDWFSFTATEDAWIDVQWGFQVLAAWVHTRFGVVGLTFAKASIGALAVAFAWTAGRSHWPALLRVLVWIPALLLMSSRFFPRPEIFTLLFTAIFLSILFHAERRPFLLWLLPVIQVLWANFHGLFIFGPILLSMYWVQAILRMDEIRGLFRHLLPVTLLVFTACLVSPYRIANIELIRELWLKMGSDGQLYRDNITELVDLKTFWSQGGSHNPYVWLLVGLLGLSALSLVCAWRDILIERRVFHIIPLVAFGYLALQATRNGNHFAMVAAVVIGWNLCSPKWTSHLAGTVPNVFAAGLLLLTLYFVGSGRWYLATGEGRQLGLGIEPSHYSLESMRLAGIEGMPQHALLFHLGHASTYIYENGPERKVFMDARLELHSEQEFRDYITLRDWMSTDSGPWRQALERNGIDLVFADSEQSAAIQATLIRDPAWEPIWFDEVMGVFLRRSWPRPKGTEAFDFRKRLFETKRTLDTPLPEPTAAPDWWLAVPDSFYPSTADKTAEAALRLGTALSTGNSSLLIRNASLWYAVQNGVEAVYRRPWEGEAFRDLGVALALLGNAEGSNTDGKVWPASGEADWPITQVVSAWSMASLRKALDRDPNDFSANFYLAQRLHTLGASDWGITILDHLMTRRARNRAQAQLLESLPGIKEQWRTALAAKGSSLPQGANTLTAAAAGRLGAHLKANIEPTNIDPAALDRLALAFLTVGLPQKAQRLYDHKAVQDSLGESRLALRRGATALVDGDFPTATKELQLSLGSKETAAEGAYGLAILNLVRGAKGEFLKAIELGVNAEPNEGLQAALKSLRNLSKAIPTVKSSDGDSAESPEESH